MSCCWVEIIVARKVEIWIPVSYTHLNFPTIRKAVKKMATIDKLTNDGTYSNLSKREVLQISRQRAKLEKNLSLIHI